MDLDNFRKEWKQELGLGSSQSTDRSRGRNRNDADNGNEPSDLPKRDKSTNGTGREEERRQSIEAEAHKLFLEGVHLEKERQYFDAIRCYKKALNLVPDIEYRFTKLQQQQQALQEQKQRNASPKTKTRNVDRVKVSMEGNDDDDFDDLESKFLYDIEQSNWSWFEKHRDDGTVHFQNLPEEVVKYILRWVVSHDLDIRSLGTLGCVSKGFYIFAREENLWKDICAKTWNHLKAMPPEFTSYREMYLRRPRVKFDGCYISKISYIRAGENSFQDQSYRPWHIVEYYRYLRFKPNGQFYFLTTAEVPVNTVPALRDPLNQTKFPGVLFGSYYYSLDGEHIYGQCWNPQKMKSKKGGTNVTYNFVLKIFHSKKKFSVGLSWVEYYLNLETVNGILKNDLRMEPAKFPNFFYSRVKSFNKEAQAALLSSNV